MSEKRDDTFDWESDDVVLDKMLVDWAKEEIDVPDGFHTSVMQHLRNEMLPQSQKGRIRFLSQRHKKAWTSVAVAVVLMLCCMPVLQNQQAYKNSVENDVAEPYMQSRQSRMIEGADTENELMTTALFDETEHAVYDGNGEEAVAFGVSGDIFSLEEQIACAETKLEELETQLAESKNYAERTALEEKIIKLREKIEQLKAQ